MLRKLLAGILTLVAMVSSCLPAMATEIPRPDANGLTVLFEVDGEPMPDVLFRLWHVAEADSSGSMHWMPAMTEYRLNLDPNSSRLASTLEGYLLRDKKTPRAQGKTDKDGLVTFNDLSAGLYLVVGDSVEMEDRGKTYTVKPTTTFITIKDNQPSTLDAKHEKKLVEDTVDRKVLKVWKNAKDGTRAVPETVTVQLLKDGEVYDTQKLNEDNNWRYTWEDLSDQYTWEVVEKNVPDGYSVDIEKQGITFVITNTKDDTPKTPPPNDPDDPTPPPWNEPTPPDSSEPTPPDSSEPTPPPDTSEPVPPDSSEPTPPPDTSELTPPDSSEPAQPSNPGKPSKLPQTGLDWEKVCMLSAAGAVLCMAGLICRVVEDHREKKDQ